MDQPLDFSKTSSNPAISNQLSQLQIFNNINLLKETCNQSDYSSISNNSDENLSRSYSNSPNSLQYDPELVPKQLSAKKDIKNNFINDQNAASFLLSQNFTDPAHIAAVAAVSNIIHQQSLSNQFSPQKLNSLQSIVNNQLSPPPSKLAKQSKSSHKSVSRKSMIMAKQKEEQKSISPINLIQATVESAKFGVLSDSQNSNINSEFSNSISQNVSTNSNLSSDENSILSTLLDDKSKHYNRRKSNPVPNSQKDSNYYIRRQKNNEAAKKSRDAKREKDLLTARRAVLLEQENSSLKVELDNIRRENLILRSLLDDEIFYDEQNEKSKIDEIISIGPKIEVEKVRKFAKEFTRIYGLNSAVEYMDH